MQGDIRRGIRVWRDLQRFDDTINVVFYEEIVGEGMSVAKLGPFEKLKPMSVIPADAVQALHPALAQQLMNSLWDVGIRPAQGQGSAGQLEATRAHLDDMRALVFKSFKPALTIKEG